MGNSEKPFCVKGGECIGNVPTNRMVAMQNNIVFVEGGLSGGYGLTEDGEWHILDLNSAVGDYAVAVLLQCKIFEDTTLGTNLSLRCYGDISMMMRRYVRVLSAESDYFQCVIGLDENQKLEYMTNVLSGTVYIVAWFNKIKL